jgi:hypothetical protein
MARLKLIAGQVVTLGVVLGSLYYGKLNPRILSFAFILVTLARLSTVQWMNRLSRRGDEDWVGFLQSKFFRPPPRGVRPPYYTYGDSGRPVGFGAYFLVAATVFGTAFILLHVDARQELSFSWPVFRAEMGWAMLIALVYWLTDLLGRDIIFDANRPPMDNLAYNNRSLTLLAVAVLLAAGLVVFFQSQNRDPNPWVLYGPVLALVHLTEIWRGLKKVG